MREKKPKILMIDDDEQILFAMKAVFEYQGWESLSAQDVLGGLRLLRSEKPDLILIDYHLPQINGIKGVQMIRELDGEIPIIVFTIDESQEVADRFIEAGASDFALKPIKVPDIISRIRLHIRLMEAEAKLGNQDGGGRKQAKGIVSATSELIEDCLRRSGEFLAVETIAEQTGLACQTTYRYLQHMAAQGLVEVNQSYGKVGRPKQKYRILA